MLIEEELPEIKGVRYVKEEDAYYHQSLKNKEKEYYLYCEDRKLRKRWTCDCADFLYRKKEKKQICKHIERIQFIDKCRLAILHRKKKI